MTKTLEKRGKTVDEALNAALAELSLDRDSVSFQVLELPRSGFFGIGASPAVIRVEYEVPDPEPEAPAPAPEKPERPAREPREEKPEKREKPERTEKREKPEKAEKREKPEKAEKPAPVEAQPQEPAPAPADENPEYAAIRSFLSGLLERMNVKAGIEISPRDNGGVNVNLVGSGIGAVIGRRGETLDAIQHLTNYVVNRGSDKHMHISVDAESYRSKREESLTKLAEKMAEKAIKYKRSMALEPMNSYERHVIHTALQNVEGVTTSSTGVEPNRRVVVSYVRPEQPSNKPQSREWA
ncbi:MAG: Jag N-terminal domain-containing protein [Oscillospiraceae bacterium]|nr:Jag N-terminal domain-containing protein [Oscillospiraceae bacterium]